MKKLHQLLGAILCLAALLNVTAPYASAANGSFSDVPADAWFAGAVTGAVENVNADLKL